MSTHLKNVAIKKDENSNPKVKMNWKNFRRRSKFGKEPTMEFAQALWQCPLL